MSSVGVVGDRHCLGRSVSNLISIARRFSRASSPVSFLARRFVRSLTSVCDTSQISRFCLDVGAGTSPHRHEVERAFQLSKYFCFDVAPSDCTDVVGDASRMPFSDGAFGLVVCFDAIQHVEQSHLALDEMARVLSPGGYVLMTFPFLYPECDFRDFRRWTLEGMFSELGSRGFEVIRAERRGGWLFALACWMNWAVQHAIPGQRRSWRSARGWPGIVRGCFLTLLTLPTTALAWLFLVLDRLLPDGGLYMGASVLARKRRVAEAL